MKKKGMILGLLATAAIIATQCSDNDNDNNNSKPQLANADKTFVEQVALANMTEINFGNKASSMASDSAVRAFAQKMVSEHNTAQQELKNIADNYRNVTWPTEMDTQHRQLSAQLDSLQGFRFDSLYIASQIMDHQSALTLFQQESTTGSVNAVKNYAIKYQPHIQDHLDNAMSIKNTLHDSTHTQPTNQPNGKLH